MKWFRKHIFMILLGGVMLVGAGLLMYPSFSEYWNSRHQTRAISEYKDVVQNLEEEKYDKILSAARKYNKAVSLRKGRTALTHEEESLYNEVLNVADNGLMCYVEIPQIDVQLPVYHGSKESILQVAIGHIEWSSLPVGGRNTHTILSGHRGLPSAKLFTELDELREGDIFMIHVLDRTLTYQVDKISVVEPDDLESLKIEKGRDLCTLVTCTPYGINTHRLLVRGGRIYNYEALPLTSSEASQVEPVFVAPVVMAMTLAFMLFGKRLAGRIIENYKNRMASV